MEVSAQKLKMKLPVKEREKAAYSYSVKNIGRTMLVQIPLSRVLLHPDEETKIASQNFSKRFLNWNFSYCKTTSTAVI